MFRSTSRFNIPFFDIRSALQKSIRRGIVDDTVFYTSELDISGLGNSAFTSLILFASEDVSIADPLVIYNLHYLYNLWDSKLRSRKLKKSESYKSNPAKHILITAAIIVAEAKKTRLLNHASTIVNLIQGNDTKDFDKLLFLLDKALKEKDECHALYYANRIHIFTNIDKKERKNKDGFKKSAKEIFKLIWDLYYKYCKKCYKNIISVLWEIMSSSIYGKQWSRLVLFYPILFITRKPNVYPIFEVDKVMVDEYVNDMYSDDVDLRPIQDYVYDKHTIKGKHLGRGIEHFFEVGAKLTNIGYDDNYRNTAKKYYLALEKHFKPKSVTIRKMIRDGKYKIYLETQPLIDEMKKLCINYKPPLPLKHHVLICGDRKWDDKECIRKYIETLSSETVIIEGECTGADQISKEIAEELGMEVLKFPANWSLGKKAGPLRNAKMLKEGKPNLVVAFHNDIDNSKGTKNMIDKAKKAGIKVKIITQECLQHDSNAIGVLKEPQEEEEPQECLQHDSNAIGVLKELQEEEEEPQECLQHDSNAIGVLKERPVIKFYSERKDYGFMSNFFKTKNLTIDEIKWKTSEHYFQAMKFKDYPWYFDLIRNIGTPAQAAYLGRMKKQGGWAWKTKLNHYIIQAIDDGVKIKEDWEDIKDDIMYQVVYEKFYQDPLLKEMLLETENAILVEHTPRDSYWGDGGDESGKNKLGEILMKVRNQLEGGALRLAREDNCEGPTLKSSWIVPKRILFGSYPGAKNRKLHKHMIEEILDCRINTFISLLEEGEEDWKWGGLNSYQETIKDMNVPNIEFYNYPIPDNDIVDDDIVLEIIANINKFLDKERNIYIHCYGGKGRTGTIMAVFIGKTFGQSGKEAMKTIRMLYDCRGDSNKKKKIPQSRIQRQQVYRIIDGKEREYKKKLKSILFDSTKIKFDYNIDDIIFDKVQTQTRSRKPPSYFATLKIPEYNEEKIFIKGPLKSSADDQCRVDSVKEQFDIFKIGCNIFELNDGDFLILKDHGIGVPNYNLDDKGNVDTMTSGAPMLIRWYKKNEINDHLANHLVLVLLFRFIFGISDTNPRNLLVIRDGYNILSVDEMKLFHHSPQFYKIEQLFSHKASHELLEVVSNELKRYKNKYLGIIQGWREIDLSDTFTEDEIDEVTVRLNNLYQGLEKM
jgi:N-glycosidase YbiA